MCVCNYPDRNAVLRSEAILQLKARSDKGSRSGPFKIAAIVVPRICSRQDEEGMEVKRERERQSR